MKPVVLGHKFQLDNRILDLQGSAHQLLQFVDKESTPKVNGTTTQEVVRALISRVKHVHEKLPHPNNDKIIQHLRMVIALHEGRALERKVERNELNIEYARVSSDGHIVLDLLT